MPSVSVSGPILAVKSSVRLQLLKQRELLGRSARAFFWNDKSGTLRNTSSGPNMLALAGASALMLTIGIPWWRWAHPAIGRTLQREQ